VALFGIPAQLEGNLIRIPNGLVGVNEACSGVRSLQTSLMIGLLFGELKRLSIFRRVMLVFAAAAIAFFGNCARAFFLVWIAATRWYRAHESSLVASTRWDVKWPQTAPNFRDVRIDEQVQNILRFDHGQAAAWRLPALDSTNDGSSATRPLICTVYFFRWKAG